MAAALHIPLTGHHEAVLAQLPEPTTLWRILLKCFETPRPSKKQEQIRAVLLDLAKQLHCEAFVDSAGNVIIRKAATPGKEKAPSVCIQSHMDIVCSKNNDVQHDFEKDMTLSHIEGEWLKATGTTLGADDGIGVAASLALLSDPSAIHGPLELLITADEELDMGGAENVDLASVKSQYLINVDSEEEFKVCIGCAGGVEMQLHLPLAINHTNISTTHTLIRLTLKGCLGGHTGIDIHKGKANAIKLLSRILLAAQHTGFLVSSYCGGTAPNAIPRECTAEVWVESTHLDEFRRAARTEFEIIKREYDTIERKPLENGELSPLYMELVEELLPAADRVAYTRESGLRLLDLITTAPHGVLRMSPDVPGLVETSISLSIVGIAATAFTLTFFARSSSEAQLDFVARQLLPGLARLAGANTSEETNRFPGWQPKPRGALLDIVKKAHAEVMPGGREPEVYAVHAGLECGFLLKKFPNLECVSIGPLVVGAHSPDERLYIPSVPRFYALLKRAVEKVASL